MSYKDRSIKKYLNDLSAKLPAPGGGSAAAMVSGLGVGLLSMVINFTLGKPSYIKYEEELKKSLSRTESLKEKFLKLLDEDVEAYRSRDLWYSLEVPLKIAQLCYEAIKICPILLEKGNRNLISDVACAGIFLEAGFSGAYFNVEANLKFIKDKKLVARIRREILKEARKIKKIREKMEEEIGNLIRR